MRLRQVALVARDLGETSRALRAVLGLGEPFHDPGVGVFGLENSVFAIGDTFLEVVSPVEDGTTAGRLLDRRGDGGYMAIFQVADLGAERAHLAQLAPPVRIAWEVTLDDAATIHLHPKDVGGAIVSLDTMAPPPSWKWAGPGWEERGRGLPVETITACELAVADPLATARRWADVLGRSLVDARDGPLRIPLDGGEVRFGPSADGRSDGIAAIELRAPDPERVFGAARAAGLAVHDGSFALAGVRFRIVA